QTLVLELRERRVHRAGARAPHALAALLDLLHDLVTVARLLRQQQQRRYADIPAPRLAPTAARAPRGAEGPAECGAVAASVALPPVAAVAARPAATARAFITKHI